jgi:hypothetical protein
MSGYMFRPHRAVVRRNILRKGSDKSHAHKPFILWHVDPLLGNDSEIRNYTTDVAT